MRHDRQDLIAGQAGAAPARPRLHDGLGLVLLLVVVALACSWRIAPAPGVEFYLGPFFYLLAYRTGGLRVGLIAAAATMLPTYFWWGHGFSIGLAMAHVLFLHAIRSRIDSLGMATFVYQASIGLAATYAFAHLYYDMPTTAFTLVFVRKALNDIILASVADMTLAILSIRLWPFRLQRRPRTSILAIRQTASSLFIGLYAITFLVVEVQAFEPELATMRRDVGQQIAIADMRVPQQDRFALRPVDLDVPGVGSLPVVFSHSKTVVANMVVARGLGCSILNDGSRMSGPNDRLTFIYWLQACQLGSVEGATGPVFFVFPTGPRAEAAYAGIIQRMSMAAILLLLAGIWQLYYNHVFRRSVTAWLDLVDRFGTPDLVTPKDIAIEELVSTVDRFVATNNEYAAAISQREQLANTVATLTRSLNLLLISDVAMNTSTGVLSYIEHRNDRPPVPVQRRVDEPSRLFMLGAVFQSDVSIELHFEGDSADCYYLLLASALSAPGRWPSGYLKRVHESQRMQDRFLQKARLVQLGVMASALSHELKQPLFTIALAASNGAHALAGETGNVPQQARKRFEKIEAQVERSRSIIDRILGYSTAAQNDTGPFDLIEALNTAIALMKPLLIETGVGVQVTDDMGRPVVLTISRVAVEQIMVSALQNAIDAIETRRAADNLSFPGVIVVRCGLRDGSINLDITDNGCGLPESIAATAFESFVTTKSRARGTGLGLFVSRQIMRQLGGSIAIRRVPPPAFGTTLSVVFPTSAINPPGNLAASRLASA